ncbi:putative family 17 glucosidase SCW4 [Cytospora mali]|uniref:Family 17 glucosidase SCW4 n=1 Tax=Cytospora mali TaxID=578113 RepID=A0A194V2W1_CYTMA|nr:putative family 17 glucosidase SCW4 [Valsa mali var. pyri (nom. inval.)]
MRFNKKAVLGIAALASTGATAAHHRHHHRKLPLHHLHAANNNNLAARSGLGDQTVTITDNTRTEPTTIPEIVVFVDKNGVPVSTAQAQVMLVPPTGAPSAEEVPDQVLAAHHEAHDEAHPPLPSEIEIWEDGGSAAATNTGGAYPVPEESGTPVSNATGSGLFGVAYAPYNADGSCKSANQIMQDFNVAGQTYGMVRVYSVDCNQIPNVYAAAKANNLKVMFGIFSLDNLGDQIATLVKGINSDWSLVDTVSVGNELVNNGQASPKQITDALTSSRQLLRQSGWTGPVVTVDTFMAVLAHPELCQASDYCAVNIHPFFDPNTAPGQAGVFVANQVQNIRNKLGNPSARVRVTESGWPWQGAGNGQAVPGVEQQAAALNSIKAAFASNPEDMVLFSIFNDLWKTAAAGTFYAEQYWGIGTANAPSA